MLLLHYNDTSSRGRIIIIIITIITAFLCLESVIVVLQIFFVVQILTCNESVDILKSKFLIRLAYRQ